MMKPHVFFLALAIALPACRDDSGGRDRRAPRPDVSPALHKTLDNVSRESTVLEMRAELAVVEGERRTIAAGASQLAAGSAERARVEQAAVELDSRIKQVRTLVDALHAAPADIAAAREQQARRAMHELHRASGDAWRTLYDAARARLRPAS